MNSAIFKTFFLALIITASTISVHGQTASLLPNAKQQFLDNNGKPLTSGTVDFYTPTTTTRKATWQNSTETILNTNPVVLDAGGRAIIYGDGSYRQVVKDRLGNIIWDQVTSSSGSGGGSSTATGDGDLVGTVKPWAGLAAPNQYLFTYGQEVSRTTYASLFTAITSSQAVFCNSGSPTLSGLSDTNNFPIGGAVEVSCIAAGNSTIVSKTSSSLTLAVNANLTTNVTALILPWGGGNHSTTFNLPDFRGLSPVGNNIMGGVASSHTNITDYSNIGADPNSIGAIGGSSNTLLAPANLPPYTPLGTITNGAITNTVTGGTAGAINTTTAVGAAGHAFADVGSNIVVGSVQAASTFVGSAQGGTSTTFINTPPSMTINFIIKVTPDANSATASGVTSFGGMTGSIACGTGLTCTGNIVSSAATALNVSFAQNGTGAVTTNLDYLLRGNVVMPEMFKAATCDGTDDGPAIQRAITYAATIKARVQLKNCTYTVTTPIVDSSGVDLTGSGFSGAAGPGYTTGTNISFQPASGGLIAYRVRNAGNIVSGGSISNIHFYAPNTAFTSTAIEVEDVSHYRISNVFINGGEVVPGIGTFWLGTGIRTKGREFAYIDHVFIFADLPINVSDNPNNIIDIDVSSFTNLSLTANGNPGIKIDSGVNYTRFNLSDVHVAAATYCIDNNDTTATAPSIGFTIRNLGCEQSTDTASYNIRINRPVAGPLQEFTIDGYHEWDNTTHGIRMRNVQEAKLSGVFFQGLAKTCIDVDNTVTGLNWTNSRWQCTAASFTGQNLVWSDQAPGGVYVYPRNATYCSTAEAACSSNTGLVTSYHTNTNNLVSSTFNNVGITVPASTSTFTLGSGKTVTLSNTMTQTATDGATIAFGAGGTVAYAAGGGAALTKVDDTNVTLTLGGSPTVALLAATSITAGWTGTLAVARGGTGISSFGTGVGTALGINVGSAGAFVTNGGALGTPSSGVATNLTGTAASLTAGNATNTAITDDTTTNASMFPTWVTTNTGNLPQKVSSTKFSFNPSTGTVSATNFSATTNVASTTFNNVVLTAPGSTATLTLGSGKTLTSSNTLTLTATDGSTLAIGAGGTLGSNAYTSTAYAPLASPTFTGVPAAPTAAVDTNTTQIATTAMVLAQAASATPLVDGTAAVGTSTRYARGDHVHPLPPLGLMIATATGIDFNSANTDTAITIPTLPAGFTRFSILRLNMSHASASLTTSTFGLFTNTGGAGLGIFTATANTVSSASDATAGNGTTYVPTQNGVTMVSASLPVANTLRFRVITPQGSAATGDVSLLIVPAP